MHDSLTGLLNLRGLDSVLSRLFNQPTPHPIRLALLQIDLDNFKEVNDTHGHEAGNNVLCAVASILTDVVRRSDIVGRQGGDEFMAILIDVESAAAVREIADRLIERIKQPIEVGHGNTVEIGASVGIAFRSATDSAGSLRERADKAMYDAKRNGGGIGTHLADTRRLIGCTGGTGEDR
jgi:diguanylate cyclase (GGDEF)-like protein